MVGKGSKIENLDVPGCFVFLCHDGTIVAATSNNGISIHGILLDYNALNTTTTQAKIATNKIDLPSATCTTCSPYQNTSTSSHAGDMNKLLNQLGDHVFYIAISEDASIVYIGINLYLFESRGLVHMLLGIVNCLHITSWVKIFGDFPFG